MLSLRTPRRLIASCISATMETDIMFMMNCVLTGQEQRYQQWFTDRFLPRQAADNIIPDLIRFVVCNYHPSNEAEKKKETK